MYRSVSKQTRPALTVPFWNGQDHLTDDDRNYLQEHFISTGKLINTESNVVDNGLGLETVNIWIDETAYLSFRQDQYIRDHFITPQQEYRDANNIQFEISGGAI